MKGRVRRASFPLSLEKHVSISAPAHDRCQRSLQNQSGQLTNRKRRRPASPSKSEGKPWSGLLLQFHLTAAQLRTSQMNVPSLSSRCFAVHLRAQSSHGCRLGCWNVSVNYPFMCLLLIMFFCCNSSVLLFDYSGERKLQILGEAGTSHIFCIFCEINGLDVC